jgi:hypothetical protein
MRRNDSAVTEELGDKVIESEIWLRRAVTTPAKKDARYVEAVIRLVIIAVRAIEASGHVLTQGR